MFPSIDDLCQTIHSRVSRRVPRNRRKTLQRTSFNLSHDVEQLESRILLTVSTPPLGAGSDVVFTGDANLDSVVFSVASGGLLHHTLGGKFGFTSNTDLDAVTPGDQTRFISNLTSLTYNDSDSNDNVTFSGINAFTLGPASLTVGAGTISVDGGTALSSDDGAINLMAGRNILLDTGAHLTTVDGGITLSANLNGTATGDFIGVDAHAATIETTGTGNISLTGAGGDDTNTGSHYGVRLNSGTSVISTSTGPNSGTITIDGTGGVGSSVNRGVFLWIGTSITSVDGDISITGQGGGGTSSNYGVDLSNIDTISSTGTGTNAATITIDGTGGDGTSNSNFGVSIFGSTTDITSVNGTISITGHGGGNGPNSGYNKGVRLYQIEGISSTGTGPLAATIMIDGIGGIGTGSNMGVEFSTSTNGLASVDGDISITGQGGDGSGRYNRGIVLGDIDIVSSGAELDAATISIVGIGGAGNHDNVGVALFGGSLSSEMGAVSIAGQGGNGSGQGNHGVALSDVSTVSSRGTGAGAATITIDGAGGTGTSTNYGVIVSGNSTNTITSIDGAISITGQGGNGSSTQNHGVYFVDIETISSTGVGPDAGTIRIDGTGGTGGGKGLYVIGATSLTSVDGAISLGGQGGNSSFDDNSGIHLVDVETISSTGTDGNAATITINGTGGAGATDNYGVYVEGTATDVTSVDGAIAINGQGGGDGSERYNYGVYVNEIDSISSLGTGADAATITISGTGGNGTSISDGVYVRGAGTVITSADGDILINGGGGTSSYGVRLLHGETSSTGTGLDAATITITGNRSGSAGSVNGGIITSIDGDVLITGGTDSNASASLVSSTGTGANAATITITNTGNGGTVGGSATSVVGDILISGGSGSQASPGNITSTGLGADAATITIVGGSVFGNVGAEITSVVGDISITGSGRSSSSIAVIFRDYTIASTGTDANAATITIVGTGSNAAVRSEGVLLRNAIVTSVVGDISITGHGAGTGASSSYDGVYLDDVQISSTGTGADAATITIAGTAGDGTTGNDGVYIRGTSTAVTSVTGAISIAGRGGNGSGNNYGVNLSGVGAISSAGTGANAATITINGTGGDGISYNIGVYSVGSSLTSVDGAISVIGQGGNGSSANNYGVRIVSSNQISSTGQGMDAATITIDGTGGNSGDHNYGVEVRNSTGITSIDGDIVVTGQGGTGGWGVGTSLDASANISSTGLGPDAATISILGNGGSGGTNNRGVELEGNSAVTSVDGDISVVGHAGSGSQGYGIYANNFGTMSSTGTGSTAAAISLNGTSSTNNGIYFASGTNAITSVDGHITISGQTTSGTDVYLPNVVGGPIATGDITINADLLCFCYTTSVQSTGSLTFQPNTASMSIGIGGGTSGLRLHDGDISKLADGFSSITIGDVDNGTGTVDIDTATFTDPVIIAGGNINDNAGTDIDAGTNSVTVIGNVSPGQSPGILKVIGDFVVANNDTFDVEIGGTTPGNASTDHDQIDVAGTVTIGTGVTLDMSSFDGFTPLANQQFVIINNDGTDAVSGTFDGLPEGAIIPNFLGSSLSASISYLGANGATGNDVVVAMVDNLPPTAHDDFVFADEDGPAVATDVTTNDTDPDATDLLTVLGIDTTGTLGAVTMNGDGTIVYDPNGQFEQLGLGETATDSFTYALSDGAGGTDIATVNVTVTGAADTLHWQGDVDTSWSVAGNWLEDQVPRDGDSLVFDATTTGFTGDRTLNDFVDFVVGDLTIIKGDSNSTYALDGNGIILNGQLSTSGTSGWVDIRMTSLEFGTPQAFNQAIRTNYRSEILMGEHDLLVSGSTQWFFEPIRGSGDITVSTGTVFLGSNTYSGVTRITSGGSFRLSGNGTLGDTTNGTTIEDAKLELYPNVVNQEELTFEGESGKFTGAAGAIQEGDLVLNSAHMLLGTLPVGTGEFTIGGDITSTSGPTDLLTLNPVPGFPLVLASTNSDHGYAETRTQHVGIVRLDRPNQFPDSGRLGGSANGVIDLNGFSESVAGITGIPTIDLSGGTLVIEPSSFTQFNGTITGIGNLTKRGPGNQLFVTSSDYIGTTTILEGRLTVGGSGEVFPDDTDVIISAGATLALANRDETVGTIAGNGTVELGSGTLTTVVEGAVDTGVQVVGTGAVVKAGNGIWNLTQDQPYTGPTVIEAGQMLIEGLLASSNVTASTGAEFVGSGVATGDIVVQPGAVIAPQARTTNTSVLTTGNLELQAGSVFAVDINGAQPGTEYDQLSVVGSVNLSNAILVAQSGFSAGSNTTLTLIDNDGADQILGTFNGLPEGAGLALNGVNYRISYVGGDGNDVILSNEKATYNFAVSNYEVSEGDTTATNNLVTVTRTNSLLFATSVDVWLADGSAAAGADYSAGPFTLHFARGETNKTVPIEILGETTVEANEEILLSLASASHDGLTGTTTPTSTLTVINDDAAVAVIESGMTAAEGTGSTTKVTFFVQVNNAVQHGFDLHFVVNDGTATKSDDFDVVTMSPVHFAGDAGESHAIVVQIVGDDKVESDEAFQLALGAISGLNPGIEIADITTGSPVTGTILNDDSSALIINDVSQNEDNGPMTFTVTLSNAVQDGLTVEYATADGTAQDGGAGEDSDYAATSGMLTFIGSSNEQQTLSVPISPELKLELDETFTISLSNLTSPNAAASLIDATDMAIGTIANDDVPAALSISNTSQLEGDAGTTTLEFTVSLSSVSNVPVTVDYATTDGTATGSGNTRDFNPINNQTLTFAPGETSQTVMVDIVSDTMSEFDETFLINLSSPTNALIIDGQAVGTIVNDDTPPNSISINDVSLSEGSSGTTVFEFSVTLLEPSTQTVTVDYRTSDGTADGSGTPRDYNKIMSGTLTFAPGQTSQSINVEVIGDEVAETDETFFVDLSNSENAVILDGHGEGIILNDDTPPVFISINDVTLDEGNASTTAFRFTVALSTVSSEVVTVDFSTADGTADGSGNPKDYSQLQNGRLTFAPGETSQTVEVLVIGDNDAELDESFLVNLSNPSQAVVADGQGIGTILNDDAPPIFISIADVAMSEGNGGPTTFTFTVSLSRQSDQSISVDYTTADGTATSSGKAKDYQKQNNGTLIFAPGETSKTITIVVNGDLATEPNETFFVNLSNAVDAIFSDNQAIGTIIDDDTIL